MLPSALIALAFIGLGVIVQERIRLPPNSLPWRPPYLNAPPGWIAHWQLNDLARDAAACRKALAATPLTFTPMKDRRIDNACGFTNVVRVTRDEISFHPHLTATCGLTAALYWYQKRLAAIARAQLHTRLTGVEQLGTFACRNVNSQAGEPRSQHATANAIDIAGFRFANGQSVSVSKDYGKPTPQGRFLDAAHDAACKLFNTVLGPHYNRLHATHFHLGMGPYRICS